MQAGQGFGQGGGGHHHPVHQRRGAAQRAQHVLGHLLAMHALQRQVGQVVVQFVDLECGAEAAHALHLRQFGVADPALHHHRIGGDALHLHRVEQARVVDAVDLPGLGQRLERLNYPVVAAAERVAGMRQDPRQRLPRQRLPGELGFAELEAARLLQAQARRVGRVVRHDGQPALQQRVVRALRPRRRGGLQQQRLRRPQGPLVQRRGPQAQVHVGTAVGEAGRIEPGQALEQFAPHQHAALGHGAVAVRHLQPAHVASLRHRLAGEGMAGAGQQPGQQTGVGDGGVRGHALDADDADLRALRMVHQFVQPAALDHGAVGVQEQQVIALRLGRGQVARLGLGHALLQREHADAAIAQFGHRLQPCADRRRVAGVVDQQQFVGRVGGGLEQADHQALQGRQIVLGDGHDRNRRLLRMAIVDAMQPARQSLDLGVGIAACLQMAGDRTLARLRARGGVGRRRDQQRLRQMYQAGAGVALEQAQDQLQFQRAGVIGIEPAQLLHQGAAEHPMPGGRQRIAQQQVQVRIRAQHRGQGLAVQRQPFVGIQRAAVRLLRQFQQQPQQAACVETGAGAGAQEPVRVAEFGQCGVEACRLLAGRQRQMPDPRIRHHRGGGVAEHSHAQRGEGGAV